MKKIILLAILTVLLNTVSYSQSTFNSDIYKIEGEITGLKDTSIILAYYFGGKQYARDTAITKNGKFSFTGNEKLEGGMYLVVLPQQQWFDIIISEQKFKFKTSLNNLVEKMEFVNSSENTPFYSYLNYITNKQKEVGPIREKLKTASANETKKLKQQQDKIDSDVLNYRTEFFKKT